MLKIQGEGSGDFRTFSIGLSFIAFLIKSFYFILGDFIPLSSPPPVLSASRYDNESKKFWNGEQVDSSNADCSGNRLIKNWV